MTQPWLRSGPFERRVVRFVTAGGLVAGIYAGAMALLTVGLDVPAQLSLVLSYSVSILTHFNLQRHFVFSDREFALTIHQQAWRYAIVVLTQYGVTAVGLHILTQEADLSAMGAYAIMAPSSALFTFVVLRTWLFHEEPATAAGQSEDVPSL